MMLNPGFMTGEDFINRFVGDYTALEGLGYRKPDILSMLCTQQYVRDFCDTPDWITAADKLPKGYKWTDGYKYQIKAGKNWDSRSYTLLPAGDDLYISGLLDKMYTMAYLDADGEYYARNNADGTRELKYLVKRNKQICVIRRWKDLPATEVLTGLHAIMTPMLETAILETWHKHGAWLGYNKTLIEQKEV